MPTRRQFILGAVALAAAPTAVVDPPLVFPKAPSPPPPPRPTMLMVHMTAVETAAPASFYYAWRLRHGRMPRPLNLTDPDSPRGRAMRDLARRAVQRWEEDARARTQLRDLA